jgi:AraC family transcriptional regulator of adaptative response/methylated-DNA-[protein]-cysteine methyltransferase
LHDLFISIEGMTPAEYRDGGKQLYIRYSFAISPFGNILIASTPKGICHLAFFEDRREYALATLIKRFPHAAFAESADSMHSQAIHIFALGGNLPEIKLHLKGTPFQLKVWQALLQIPLGGLSTYGRLAADINNPAAARAVGTAIGSNPVAFLIPCHRVIQASGMIGGYMWGPERKTAILGWEAAHTEPQQ